MGAIVFAVGVAFLRMAFGGHFLSDVVMAALLTELIAICLMAIFHNPRWRYGRRGMLEQDIRNLPSRFRAQASPHHTRSALQTEGAGYRQIAKTLNVSLGTIAAAFKNGPDRAPSNPLN